MTTPRTARLASVDLRDGKWIVQIYSRTEAGFWVTEGEPVFLDASATAGQLGTLVREALDASRTDLPTPPRDENSAARLLAATGTTSYGQYMKGTQSVNLRSTTSDGVETVKVTPQHNGGTSKVFTPIDEAATEFVYDSPGQLGQAVIDAFTHTT